MKVGKSVTKAIDEWEAGDLESAMLHACNAIDGTAHKQGSATKGNKARFTNLLRENYPILGPMGAPGIDLFKTHFPVRTSEEVPEVLIDIADLIYLVHRCTHGHGDELPQGFELIEDVRSPRQVTTMWIGQGKVKLSDRMIFALLSVAVANERNATERAADGYYLTFNGVNRLIINDHWGRTEDFLKVVSTVAMPQVALELVAKPVQSA